MELEDVSVRLTPLSRADAEKMVRELRTYPLLTGYRGAPPCDLGAVVEARVRVAPPRPSPLLGQR